MTCAYYDKAGNEILVEMVPSVQSVLVNNTTSPRHLFIESLRATGMRRHSTTERYKKPQSHSYKEFQTSMLCINCSVNIFIWSVFMGNLFGRTSGMTISKQTRPSKPISFNALH